MAKIATGAVVLVGVVLALLVLVALLYETPHQRVAPAGSPAAGPAATAPALSSAS